MKRILLLLAIIAMSVLAASAQDVPPVIPCGLGQPNNVPCYDTNAGKVIHTDSRMALPHENLEHPLPSGTTSDAPVVVPKIHASSVSQPKPLVQSSPPTPYWTYKGSSAYYHDSGKTDEVSVENLRNAMQAPTPTKDFANDEAIGAVGGAVVGALIRGWLAHRRRLKLERKNIKQQITAYYDATQGFDRDQRAALRTIDANFNALSRFDPARREQYLRAEQASVPWNASLTKLDSMLDKGRPVILRAKDMGFLRRMLTQAKAFYGLQREYAQKMYSLSQLSGVLVGYYEWRQAPSH